MSIDKNLNEELTILLEGEVIYGWPNVFYVVICPGRGWFRFFGKGVSAKNLDKHPLTFSERQGHVKYLRINNWVFKILW